MAVPWASPPPDPSHEPDPPIGGPGPSRSFGSSPSGSQGGWRAAGLRGASSLPCTSRVVPPELARLDGAIEELLATNPHDWDDATIDDALVGLVRLGSKLDAVGAGIGAVWDTRRLWAADGSRSAKARLGRDTGEDPGRLGLILWRATRLRTMPLVHEAWRSGEIGTDRVNVLCRANVARRAAAYAEGESLLVWMATALEDFDEFARQVRVWCDLADEAGADPDPERRARAQRDSRHLDVGEGLDGVRFLDGRLDAIDGEIFARGPSRRHDSPRLGSPSRQRPHSPRPRPRRPQPRRPHPR